MENFDFSTKYPEMPKKLAVLLHKVVNKKAKKVYVDTVLFNDVEDLRAQAESSMFMTAVVNKILSCKVTSKVKESLSEVMKSRIASDIQVFISPSEVIRIFDLEPQSLKVYEKFGLLEPTFIDGEAGYEWMEICSVFGRRQPLDKDHQIAPLLNSIGGENGLNRSPQELQKLLDKILDQYLELAETYLKQKKQFEIYHLALRQWRSILGNTLKITNRKTDEVIKKNTYWHERPITMPLYIQTRVCKIPFVTQEEVCEIGGFDPPALQKWSYEQDIPTVKEGKVTLYPWHEVEALFESKLDDSD